MAIPSIFNVILISSLFLLLYGIIGVNYLKGGLYYCSLGRVGDSKWDCLNLGGTWLNNVASFDDIYKAMAALFSMSTSVGWAAMMYKAVDSRGIDMIPKEQESMANSVYFVLFIIVGSFFIKNLFIGVVISTYNREKEKLGKDFLLTTN